MKVETIALPTDTVAFADVCHGQNTKTVLEGFCFLYPYWSLPTTAGADLKMTTFTAANSRGDNVHFRHNRTANVGWLDGHVSQEKASRIKDHALARTEFIGNFGLLDNSLYDPWNL
jgi:prepilin-type processing-associated H-X9-DG protein